MAFDYTTLITDRTAADVARVKALAAKGWAAMTADEQAEWAAEMKGAYNAGDMNRVSACMEDLAARFRALGYHVPGYERVEVQRNASRLPEGYTEVEYIESSGTQYVDTGFMPSNNTRVKIDAQYLSVASPQVLFGARTSVASKNYTLMLTDGVFRSDYNSAYTQTWSVSLQTKRDFDKDKETTTIDGISQSYTNATFQCDCNMALFALNNAGTVQWYSSVKLYSCQIYDNDTLIRDFIPCINALGEVGLYDLVNEEFYGNSGTGTFTAGTEVTSSNTDDLDPYTWYETDAPTESEAAQYLSNVAAVRRVVNQAATTPATPASMAGLTVDTANDIETILADTDRLVTNISKAWYYSGELYAGEI